MSTDTRIAELEALALEEGFRLPMPAAMIVWHENRGHVADLLTGEVYTDVTVTPARHAQAIAYLLGDTSA